MLKAYLPMSTCKTNRVKTTAQANDCTVTTKWFGFYRILKSSNKISDSVELNLPPYSYVSQVCGSPMLILVILGHILL